MQCDEKFINFYLNLLHIVIIINDVIIYLIFFNKQKQQRIFIRCCYFSYIVS